MPKVGYELRMDTLARARKTLILLLPRTRVDTFLFPFRFSTTLAVSEQRWLLLSSYVVSQEMDYPLCKCVLYHFNLLATTPDKFSRQVAPYFRVSALLGTRHGKFT